MSAQPANCANCGARRSPSGARFCAACGTPVQSGDTVRADVPPNETGPVPVIVAQATPRWFGLAPADRAASRSPSCCSSSRSCCLVARRLGRRAAPARRSRCSSRPASSRRGRRKPDTPVVTASVGAVDSARARAGCTAPGVPRRARSARSARSRRRRSRGDAARSASATSASGALGAAVYAGGDGAPSETCRVVGPDERDRRARSAKPHEIAADARSGSDAARLEVQPTGGPAAGRAISRQTSLPSSAGSRARQGRPSARRNHLA